MYLLRKIIEQLDSRTDRTEVLFSGSQKITLDTMDISFYLRDNDDHHFNAQTVPLILSKIETHIEKFRTLDSLGLTRVNIIPSGHVHMRYAGINIAYDAFLAYEGLELDHIIFSIKENRKFKELLMDGMQPVRDRKAFIIALNEISPMFDLSIIQAPH